MQRGMAIPTSLAADAAPRDRTVSGIEDPRFRPGHPALLDRVTNPTVP